MKGWETKRRTQRGKVNKRRRTREVQEKMKKKRKRRWNEGKRRTDSLILSLVSREEKECNQLLSERTLSWLRNKERTRQLNCHVKTGGWEEDERRWEEGRNRGDEVKERTEINRIKYTLCLYFPSILTQTGLKVQERQIGLLTGRVSCVSTMTGKEQ